MTEQQAQLKNFDSAEIDFSKSDGLVPAIVQDAVSLEVLMLGYMNEAALAATLETGWVTFYSRSRQGLWRKGETSGNYLQLVNIRRDCDQDALLLQVTPHGPTCHTGLRSCFTGVGSNPRFGLRDLEAIIADRKIAGDDDSYTRSLFRRGLPKIAQKLGEEATEVVIAALAQSDEAFREESADLLFHFLVLLAEKQCRLDEVLKVLQQRNKA